MVAVCVPDGGIVDSHELFWGMCFFFYVTRYSWTNLLYIAFISFCAPCLLHPSAALLGAWSERHHHGWYPTIQCLSPNPTPTYSILTSYYSYFSFALQNVHLPARLTPPILNGIKIHSALVVTLLCRQTLHGKTVTCAKPSSKSNCLNMFLPVCLLFYLYSHP